MVEFVEFRAPVRVFSAGVVQDAKQVSDTHMFEIGTGSNLMTQADRLLRKRAQTQRKKSRNR
jgi:hypothetical protein